MMVVKALTGKGRLSSQRGQSATRRGRVKIMTSTKVNELKEIAKLGISRRGMFMTGRKKT